MKYMIFFILYSLIACTSPEKKIANQIVPVNLNPEAGFEHIGNILGDKEIVILGESWHGDGKTLEIKSHLLKYLIEKKGFNTLAFEGRGFLDMEILNNETPLDSLAKSLNKQSLTNWYAFEQQDMLNAAILNNEVNFIGLESYSYFVSREPDLFIEYLRKFLETNFDYNEFEEWAKLKSIHYNISFSNTEKITEADIEFYGKSLTSMILEIQSQTGHSKNLEKEIALNSVKNAKKYAILFKSRWLYEEINYSVYNNLRDEQMAINLFWHKERNPDAKIIVWTANFHGAKKIREVRYKREDPKMYNNYILLGEHLHKFYGDKLYSIAFTSSRGETGMIGEEIKKIIAPNGSLENEIEKRDIDFGFIDFSAVRQAFPNLKDEKFNAIILGHDNKPGKWLQVFDGLFFIKENEKITSNK